MVHRRMAFPEKEDLATYHRKDGRRGLVAHRGIQRLEHLRSKPVQMLKVQVIRHRSQLVSTQPIFRVPFSEVVGANLDLRLVAGSRTTVDICSTPIILRRQGVRASLTA